jgi:uncharacterized phage protein gp47/JayE
MAFPITTIDANGVTVPLFTDVLAFLQQQYQTIYGSDINLDPDTQDGQWIGVIAAVINDSNQTVAATYLSYSPSFAIGAGLSSVVKINGIRRQIPSYSTVLVRCVGVAGTIVGNGFIGDNLNLGTTWQLPAGSTIPPEGDIVLTATCTAAGAVIANTGTLTNILTPVPGWQTVNNESPAVPGAPIETDAQLRRRQTQSVANPSQSIILGIQGGIENLPGVQRVFVYENPTGSPDINGLPAHSMAAVVEGGDSTEVAQSIALRKTPGSPTYGTTSIIVYDARGIPAQINFFELVLVPITVHITLKALAGYTGAIGQEITNQVVAFLTTLPIGYDSYYSKLTAACQVPEPDGLTYDVTSVSQARGGNTPAAGDVNISFIEATTCDATLITITVT